MVMEQSIYSYLSIYQLINISVPSVPFVPPYITCLEKKRKILGKTMNNPIPVKKWYSGATVRIPLQKVINIIKKIRRKLL